MFAVIVLDRFITRGPIDKEFFITWGVIIVVALVLIGVGRIFHTISKFNREADKAKSEWDRLPENEKSRIRQQEKLRKIEKWKNNYEFILGGITVFAFLFIVVAYFNNNYIVILIILAIYAPLFLFLKFIRLSPEKQKKHRSKYEILGGFGLIFIALLILAYKFIPKINFDFKFTFPALLIIIGITMIWKFYKKRK